MRRLGSILVLLLCTLSGCGLSFGTVGAWSGEALPPVSLEGTNSAVLPDGEVVFLGGTDPRTGQPLSRVLVFDPNGRRWRQGAVLPVQPTGSAISPTASGDLLVAGGEAGPESGPGMRAATWLYNPHLDSWRRAGDLHEPRSGAAATLLTDGRVLIAGGAVPLATPVQRSDGSTQLAALSSGAEIFDPRTNTWSRVGAMQVARGETALVALPHGMALAAGGCDLSNPDFPTGVRASAEVFDAASGKWTPTASLPEARCGANGVLLRDGRALVTGGVGSGGQPGGLSGAVLYNHQARAWTDAGPTVPAAAAPVVLSDGRVFLAAIQTGEVHGDVASLVVGGQVFDPSSEGWTYATSTTVLVASRLLPAALPTVAAQSGDTAFVLLGRAALALRFDSRGEPPSVLILDSSGLTLLLGALAAVSSAWLTYEYVRPQVRRRLGKGRGASW